MLNCELTGGEPLPKTFFIKMPPKALADRFNETGVPPHVASAFCFGVTPETEVFAKAFMEQGHVLITWNQRAAILPLNVSFRFALEKLEVACAL